MPSVLRTILLHDAKVTFRSLSSILAGHYVNLPSSISSRPGLHTADYPLLSSLAPCQSPLWRITLSPSIFDTEPVVDYLTSQAVQVSAQ